MSSLENMKIGIVGLGYVGLPLAVEFSKKHLVVGLDINSARISELTAGVDITQEVSDRELADATNLTFTNDPLAIEDCNVYIIAAPTPIDEHNQPDLSSLLKATELVAKVLKKNDILIYESTVYPGATEEVCVPFVERISGLKYNKDFFIGYSPERVNPGDKLHSLKNIVKVTSGSNKKVSRFIDDLYRSIITAGTHLAPSIKVAEAAKVIENTQRDVNIALINELSILFNKLDIDTSDVLEAASTKWNFLPFRPGLVGGHCIGVDPYYLTHKAQEVGYYPEMILAGRRINDGMGKYIVGQLIKIMTKKKIKIVGAKVLVMGLTFKENCPDLRNSKVVDIIRELDEYDIDTDIVDPWCSEKEAKEQYGFSLKSNPEAGSYDAIILAVGHHKFFDMGAKKIKILGKKTHVLYDLKHLFDKGVSDLRL